MVSDEQAIRDLMAEWRRLSAEGDADGLLALLTDDVVCLAYTWSDLRVTFTPRDGKPIVNEGHGPTRAIRTRPDRPS